MAGRRQLINLGAVLQVIRLVRTLIRLVVAMLSQIAFLALITAMSIVSLTIGIRRIWKPLAPREYRPPRVALLEPLSNLWRRGRIGLYATIQRTGAKPGSLDVIGSLKRAQEPRAPSGGGVRSEEPEQVKEVAKARVSRPSHVERRRQQLRILERAPLSIRLKAGRRKQKEKVKKQGRKEDEKKEDQEE